MDIPTNIPGVVPPISPSWNWKELLTITIQDGTLNIHVGPITVVLAMLGIVIAILIAKYRKSRLQKYDVVEIEVEIPRIGKVKIKPNHETTSIAYRAWVELKTRKAGLLFDQEHDVIEEVYNSWYELFKEFRSLTKTVPAEKLRTDQETRQLVNLMISILNDGLRPHLTKWQARFRSWASKNQEKFPNDSPQEMQRHYEHYNELLADLQTVNAMIIKFADSLELLATGENKK